MFVLVFDYVFNQPVQNELFLLSGHHIQKEGQGVRCLSDTVVSFLAYRVCRISVFFEKLSVEGLFYFTCAAAVLFRVFVYRESFGDLRQPQYVVIIVPGRCEFDRGLLGQYRAGRAPVAVGAEFSLNVVVGLADQEVDVTFHSGVVFREVSHFSVQSVKSVGECQICCPPCRVGRIELPVGRYDVRQGAVFALCVHYIVQVLAIEVEHIEVETGLFRDQGSVSHPALSLVALRAVCGNAHQIGLLAVYYVSVQRVYQRVRRY